MLGEARPGRRRRSPAASAPPPRRSVSRSALGVDNPLDSPSIGSALYTCNLYVKPGACEEGVPVRAHDVLSSAVESLGLSTAMLLARDGHHVTVLERDPAPPPEPARGVGDVGAPRREPVPPAPRFPAALPRAPRRRAARRGVGARRRGCAAHEPDGGDARRDHRRLPARTTTASSRSPVAGRWSRRRSPDWPPASPASRSAAASPCAGCVAERRRQRRRPARPRGGHRRRRARSCRPRRRRRWAPVGPARLARRRSVRGAPTRRSPTPGSSTTAATTARPTARCRRCWDRHCRRTTRCRWFTGVADNGQLVGRVARQCQGPCAAAGSVTSTTWERVARQLSAGRSLDRRRTSHRRRRDRQDRGSGRATSTETAGRWPPVSSPSATPSACTNPSVGRGASIGLLQATCLRDVLRDDQPEAIRSR